MIKIIFNCGGCDAIEDAWLKRTFTSITGRRYGIGSYHYDTPQEVAPEGWIAFDLYTGCTYCPSCWAEIQATPEVENYEPD